VWHYKAAARAATTAMAIHPFFADALLVLAGAGTGADAGLRTEDIESVASSERTCMVDLIAFCSAVTETAAQFT
jgi:hypothetical protein